MYKEGKHTGASPYQATPSLFLERTEIARSFYDLLSSNAPRYPALSLRSLSINENKLMRKWIFLVKKENKERKQNTYPIKNRNNRANFISDNQKRKRKRADILLHFHFFIIKKKRKKSGGDEREFSIRNNVGNLTIIKYGIKQNIQIKIWI